MRSSTCSIPLLLVAPSTIGAPLSHRHSTTNNDIERLLPTAPLTWRRWAHEHRMEGGWRAWGGGGRWRAWHLLGSLSSRRLLPWQIISTQIRPRCSSSSMVHADPAKATVLLLLSRSDPVPAAVDPVSTGLQPTQVPSDGGRHVDPASSGREQGRRWRGPYPSPIGLRAFFVF